MPRIVLPWLSIRLILSVWKQYLLRHMPLLAPLHWKSRSLKPALAAKSMPLLQSLIALMRSSLDPTVFLISEECSLHCGRVDELRNKPCGYVRVLPSLPQRHQPLVILDAVARGTGPDGIGDEARGQMPVMLLDHARVGMPEILRHDHERHAIHHCV
jgi:hypothetical protein